MREILVVLIAVGFAQGDPIVIKSGVTNSKDHAQQEGASVYDGSKAKGIANFEGEEGFNHASEGTHVQAQDQGKYNEENAQKNIHNNQKGFADDKFHQNAGGEVADVNTKSANKKGHHNSGYTKSFHKDESASSSSYYDDADDEQNQFQQNNHKNLYADAGQHSQAGTDFDDMRYAQNHGKNGYYNNAGNYDRNAANRKDFNNNNYYDNKENEARRNAAKAYGGGGRYYDEEQYLHKPDYYHEDYHHRPKKTITIYEDPRYYGGVEKNYPIHDDYIQLEVKRPPRDYDVRSYNRRPSYDYYY